MAESTLFIPDISGFTKFVKSTDIRHSKHIVEELINIIIKNGSDVFEVAEIEGDAVFFYANKSFSSDEIVKVARKIFLAFHSHLSQYENGRICNCGSCLSAVDLNLKFIVHSGEISLAKFGSQTKPHGDSVIEVHRLLKNKIGLNQYILFSDKFLKDSELQFDGEGSHEDASLGSIPFKFLKIDHWKSDVLPLKEPDIELNPDLTVEASIDIPLASDALLQYISDFRYRHFWNQTATKIIYDENKINAAGEDHYCIVKGKDLYFNTIKPKARPDILTYGEVLKNPTPLKYFESNFFLTPVSVQVTNLKIILRVSFKWKIQFLLLPMIKRKMKQQANIVLKSIKESIPLHMGEISKEISA